ncbi:putative F-box protein [Sesamum alatum]|uniref:F-box protein n=1 Tax=Sesamum alatum TaxID=300844 RepID=A0AAE2CIX1_9LAMI|nr:putative F-box protein [Sesamum alatum]
MEKEEPRLILNRSAPLLEEILIFEIFSRLNVKTLHRFRQVSKFCHSLTSNPEFFTAFRRRSRRRFLLSFSSSLNWRCVFHSLTPGVRGLHVPEIVDCFTNAAYCNYTRCINGVRCFVRGDSVVVCNLATDEELILPPLGRDSERDRHCFFFCYDPETHKYKVLRPVSTRIHNPMNGRVHLLATHYSIFTVGVDISWRGFHRPAGLYQLGKSKSVCVNGVLFCTNFSVTDSVKDGVIAAFDVGSENFDTVAYPDGLSSSRHSSCHLIEAKGSVGIVELESCVIRLWIKEKGFVSGSWSEHRIEFPSQWRSDISLSYNFSFSSNGDGEMIMGSSRMSTPGCWIFRYDIETGKWRRIEVVGLEKHIVFGDFHVEEYVETPLLIRDILRA